LWHVGCAPVAKTSRTQISYGPADRPVVDFAYATSSPSDAQLGSAIKSVVDVSCCALVPFALLVQRWPLRTYASVVASGESERSVAPAVPAASCGLEIAPFA